MRSPRVALAAEIPVRAAIRAAVRVPRSTAGAATAAGAEKFFPAASAH